jgi:hypothetical protein
MKHSETRDCFIKCAEMQGPIKVYPGWQNANKRGSGKQSNETKKKRQAEIEKQEGNRTWNTSRRSKRKLESRSVALSNLAQIFCKKNQVSLLLFFPAFRFNSLFAVYFEFTCSCTRDSCGPARSLAWAIDWAELAGSSPAHMS